MIPNSRITFSIAELILSDQETLAILQAERARHPELAETLDLHQAILEARAAVRATAPPRLADEATARLARGEPLLRAEDLALEWESVAHLFQTICAIGARYRPDQADAFAALARQATPSRVEQLARAYLDDTLTAQVPLDVSLAAFALNNALHPFLAVYGQAWRPLVNDALWYRATCPICGGEPDFAALEKESGARRLLCARCDAEWTFRRAGCPFCGVEAPDKLGYYPEKTGVYRLYTCENCKRYLKTIDLRELVRAANLPAERVLTIGMDTAARAAGYR